MSGEKNPLLSVIVPVFNAEGYLRKCLDSIVNQTFQNMEIIVVNDGSTDHSLEICRKYQQMDSRVRIILKENGGLIRARKTGVSEASGDLIGFVDSDDWIEPDMYEMLTNCMKDTGCDLVSSGIVRDFEDSDRQTVIYDNYPEGVYKELGYSIYPTMLYHAGYRNFGIYCNLCTKLFKKELLVQVYKYVNEDVFYGEDALTLYPYCLLAENIYVLHKAFYHYNIRSASMSFRQDRRLPYNNYLLYENLRDIFLQSDYSLMLMRQLKKYLMSLERHTLLAMYQFDVVALDEWKFSFPQELYDRRFVLYGAGACGQAFFRKICTMQKEHNMVLWVDRDAERRTQECAYLIDRPDALMRNRWDVILVSVQSGHLAQQIMDELMETYHIEQDKLYWSSVEHIPIWDIY